MRLALVVLLTVPGLVGCSGERDEPRERDRPASSATSSPTASGVPTDATASTSPSAVPMDDPIERAMALGPTRPTSAAEAARLLEAAERTIGDGRTPPDRLAAAGRVQQLAYRALGRHPRWDEAVYAALPEDLHERVRLNLVARRAFRSMHRDPADTLPAWRIVEPPPAGELRRAYREAERRYGVAWEYLAAINMVETAFGRIRGTSTAGARGPMQFIPSTWEIYGEGDIDDPRDAILAAGRFLRAQGFAHDRAQALFRYNNSTAYVRGVTALARVIEQWPRAFLGYHHWEVFFLTTEGDVHLPVGYHETKPVPVEEWLAR